MPHLAELSGTKMKLLNLYIKRSQAGNGGARPWGSGDECWRYIIATTVVKESHSTEAVDAKKGNDVVVSVTTIGLSEDLSISSRESRFRLVCLSHQYWEIVLPDQLVCSLPKLVLPAKPVSVKLMIQKARCSRQKTCLAQTGFCQENKVCSSTRRHSRRMPVLQEKGLKKRN